MTYLRTRRKDGNNKPPLKQLRPPVVPVQPVKPIPEKESK